MRIIRANEDDIRRAYELVKSKYSGWMFNTVKDATIKNKIIGYALEFAIQRIFNVKRAEAINYDFIYNGMLIDVKATRKADKFYIYKNHLDKRIVFDFWKFKQGFLYEHIGYIQAKDIKSEWIFYHTDKKRIAVEISIHALQKREIFTNNRDILFHTVKDREKLKRVLNTVEAVKLYKRNWKHIKEFLKDMKLDNWIYQQIMEYIRNRKKEIDNHDKRDYIISIQKNIWGEC